MEELCAVLNRLLKKFINERYDGNVSRAAKEINLPYRIAREGYTGKLKVITFMNALHVFQTVEVEGDNELRNAFPLEFSIHQKARAFSSDQLDDILKEYIFSSHQRTEMFQFVSGIDATKEDIEDALGKFGLVTLEDMVANNALTIEVSGFVRCVLGKQFMLQDALSLKAIQSTLPSFDPQLKGNLFGTLSGGLNMNGWTKGYEFTREYYKKMSDLFENPEFRGSILLLGALAFGPMARAFSERKGKVYE